MSPAMSEIGRAARAKGVKAERDLATFLRTWWPLAERKSETGWRAGDRESADLGDIRDTPGLVWQCKYLADMTDLDVERAMSDAEDQAVAAGAEYGVLVQRRAGKADPGRWWAWIRIADLRTLSGHAGEVFRGESGARALVRLALADLVELLLQAGYGHRPEEDAR